MPRSDVEVYFICSAPTNYRMLLVDAGECHAASVIYDLFGGGQESRFDYQPDMSSWRGCHAASVVLGR